MRDPAFVIMGGEHGKDLGWGPGQLIWGEPSGSAVKAPFAFVIELNLGALKWGVNRRTVPFKKDADLSRLKSTLTHQGSLTFLTNGSIVSFASLEIRGKLRSAWATQETARIAKEELAKLLGTADAGGKTSDG